ncbi:unnamed protein product (macronuclear) [Paramecium tetraurelia]|uniref:Cytidyltransferase-like domain-containing protein n=1 Tax=Paramecium tetraurelia TaxID=5888 RepID=A0BGZ6_PARTE|nr:uncharacterized protein GSPATT00028848001 [Paramecium tetraurelia]CAK57813.1 unnamed protein product [Paramecium tetraurelia]|eukprot:XP_001425211.1 hypothetical protein (macronuclear) [Paramecium tetraurelia strain d4-2]
MKHHEKLLIVCSFDSVGTQMLDQKLEEYLQTNQEEIILYLKRTPITHLKVYERILFHLYEKAQNYPTKFNVIFDLFNTQFKNTYQFTVNLDYGEEINIQTKQNQQIQKIQFSQEGPLANQFKRGANGGTFDHLHIGHKILLSLSLLAVNEHLTIGITGEVLLQKKKLTGFLQSYETRCKCVKEFCQLFRPDIELNFSELIDPAGPTKNGQFEVLIATQETQNSLDYINNLRKEGGLNELEGYIIGIIENSNNQGDVKLSSSQIRGQIQEKNRLSEQEYLELKSEWLSVSDNLYWFESILVDYYSQPQRYYHTLRHIYDMLQQLKGAKNMKNAKLATFFHDAIYYPRNNDNEEKSILLFQQYAKDCNIDSQLISTFILQTKSHQTDVSFLPEDDLQDLMVFLDADMSILESDAYTVYANDIRKEYSHFPDKDYKSGRIAVLQKFLKSKIFNLRSEEKARKNIQEEIEMLQNWVVAQ